MRSILLRIKNKITIWDAYYPVIIFCYILTVFTDLIHPGVIASILLVLVGIAALLKSALLRIAAGIDICDAFMAAFIIYNLLSVIWLTASKMPLYVYTGEAATFILPAVMYLAARRGRACGFYKGYFTALIMLCGAGLIFYIAAPQFYLDYLYDWSYISLADVPTMRVRMHSVCGSTILGSFSAVAILTSSYLFIKGCGKNSSDLPTDASEKSSQKSEGIIGIIGMLTGFAFAIFSNQRSAMVVAIAAIIYLNILAFFTFGLFRRRYFYIELGAIALIFILALILTPDLVLKVYYRLVSLPSAIGERSEQWVAAVNMMFSSWIGNGLGANGHRALGIEGVKVIADGGLVKLFCEDGVIGFSIFVYLLILTVKRGIKHFSDCYAELGIIGMLLLQSIGSNVLSFQLIAPVFWYAVGRIVYVERTGIRQL